MTKTPRPSAETMTCPAGPPNHAQQQAQMQPRIAYPPPPQGYGAWPSPPPPPPHPMHASAPQPALDKRRPAAFLAPVRVTVLLAFFVLLSMFSCLLTVTLSYRWHAEASREIDQLLASAGEAARDLEALTNIVRKELAAKRMSGAYGATAEWTVTERRAKAPRPPTTTGATTAEDYVEETDEDYDHDRFMGRELSNNWPAKSYREAPVVARFNAEQRTVEPTTDGPTEETMADRARRRRTAAIVGMKTAENELNGYVTIIAIVVIERLACDRGRIGVAAEGFSPHATGLKRPKNP